MRYMKLTIGRRNFPTRYSNAESSPAPASNITSASLISLIGLEAAVRATPAGDPFLLVPAFVTPGYNSGLRARVPTPLLTLSDGESCAGSEEGKSLDSGVLCRIGSSG